MTSPFEPVTVQCPQCKLIYEGAYRPSINRELDQFDDRYVYQASTIACPRCETHIGMPSLVVDQGNFTFQPAYWVMYPWSRLNHLQIGRYAEYLVKMQMTLHGLDVYSSEIDDRGIDFVARTAQGRFLEVQVKSAHGANYIFFPKGKFKLGPSLYAAIVLLDEGMPPELYLIPSEAWQSPNGLLVSHDYGEGKKSPPEWGLSLARKHRELLVQYSFEETMKSICSEAVGQ